MKKMMAGYAVFLVLVFSGCDNAPDYAPGTPEGLRAELQGANVVLHYGYSDGADSIEIFCRGPSMGGFDFFQTQLAAYSSGVTVRGESLAAFDGGAAGNYAFQVRARNGFGTSGMSSTALIFWPGMIAAGPPSEPANVYCESHWEEYRVYFERPQAATSYVLDWGSGSRDLSAVSYINGYCFVIPKGVIGTGSYSSTLTARNEYGDSTQASFTIAHVASPALNLLTPTYDAAGIYLHYSPQSYYPVGTQFKVLYGTSSPPGTSLSPLATLTGGQNRLVVPRTSFPSGSTYYFLVQAVGEFETTGVDSNTVSINIP